jgi:hypothetical protein
MILTDGSARMGWICAALLVAFSAPGCQADDGKFSCGSGTCDLDTEVCIIGGSDRCSTCVPRPATSDAEATCERLPTADDPSWGNYQCDDEGTCSEVEGGLVLTCAMPHWGCG